LQHKTFSDAKLQLLRQEENMGGGGGGLETKAVIWLWKNSLDLSQSSILSWWVSIFFINNKIVVTNLLSR
jgi:hypothetical protein